MTDCIYPLEVMRTRIIEQKLVGKGISNVNLHIPSTSLQSCFRDIFVNPWILVFGCGFQPSLVKVILYIGIKDMLYHPLKSFALSQETKNKRWQLEDNEYPLRVTYITLEKS